MESLRYVISDAYFLYAMGMTTACGIFIGSVLYDGVVEDVKKGIIAIGSYTALLLMTNLSRIIPILAAGEVHTTAQPLASSTTTLLVTIFYLLGMLLGVKITNHAHGGKES